MRSLIRHIAVLAVALVVSAPVYAVTVIKLATVAPENSSWMREMRAAAAEIEKRTDGRVDFKFFGGGVMGNDKTVLRKMRIGQLHGGAFTGGSLVSRYPDMNIYGLPFLFNSLDEVDYVRERMDAELIAGLEKAGLVSFGFAEGGFAEIMSNEPVRNLGDLANKKVWVPEGDQISYRAMEQLGLKPVTLPITDVLTGLQTHLIDIIGTSPVGAVVLQWHTKVRYVTDMPLLYLYATLVIEKKIFDRLSDDDQAIVRDVMGALYENFDKQNRIENGKAAEALVSSGLKYVEPEPQALANWRRQLQGLNDELVRDGLFSRNGYDMLRGHLREYREKNTAVAGTP